MTARGQYVLGCCLRSDAHLDIVRKEREQGLALVLDVVLVWALTMKRWLCCSATATTCSESQNSSQYGTDFNGGFCHDNSF